MHRTVATLLILIGLVAGGCQDQFAPRGSAGGPNMTDEAVSSRRWPFRPASLRVHPLTRFAADPGTPDGFLLAARVEFLDDWGVSTRALGMLTLELTDRSSSGQRPPLFGNFNLSDLAANAQQFDPITLTYVLPLRPDWPVPPEPGARLRLRIFVLAPGNERLQGQMDLTWPESRVAPPVSPVPPGPTGAAGDTSPDTSR